MKKQNKQNNEKWKFHLIFIDTESKLKEILIKNKQKTKAGITTQQN